MVKVNAQAFTYGIAFAACGVLALVGIKFTKSDEEKIKMLEQKYGKPSSFSTKSNEKMQSMLNNIKEGKVDASQERQFRQLMVKGTDSTSNRSKNITGVVSPSVSANTVSVTPTVSKDITSPITEKS